MYRTLTLFLLVRNSIIVVCATNPLGDLLVWFDHAIKDSYQVYTAFI
jgi:hypothetical protein